MTAAAAYAVGTLLVWIGIGLTLRGVYLGVRAFTLRQAGLGPMVSLVAGGICLLTSSLLLPASRLRLPLIWPVMPFVAWGFVFCLGGLLFRGFEVLLSARRRWISVIGWLFGAGVFAVLYRLTPDAPVHLLRGGIPLSIPTAIGLVVLAAGAVLAMALTAQAVQLKSKLRRFSLHLVLIAGSVLFGIPFLWLVLTSFKEERDMSSVDGLVWLPRVSQTVPYRNPDKPLFETTYRGMTVTGYVVGNPGNAATMDVQKPLGMRGYSIEVPRSGMREVPGEAAVVRGKWNGTAFQGIVIEDLEDGRRRVRIDSPANLSGQIQVFAPTEVEPVREIGLRTANYSEALDFLPPEAEHGLAYLRNTLVLVVMNLAGTLLASSLVAYSFARIRFPGKNALFYVLLSTMMLPGAVTLLPQFLIFRSLGWIDTLLPLWVPAFFGSAFNIFLLRQFFNGIPMEIEDAAKIDGCGYLRSYWAVMLPQIKPALAVIAIWTFMGAWNNFMGPLIYVNSPSHMPISYAVQMYSSDRSGEPGLLMAFTTMSIVPVLLLFFFAQRYFIEGVSLSGLGGR